jgi:SAM-dependent methyltransferase
MNQILKLFILLLAFMSSDAQCMQEPDLKSESERNSMFPSTSMPDNNWWKELWPDPKSVVTSLGVESGMVCIDLCCGDGYFTAPLAQSSFKTYGLELDGDLLEKARKEAEYQNIKNCFWIQGDAMKIDKLVSEKVDFILLANTFHGVPDKETLGKSMFLSLKSQGILAVVNWHKIQREKTTVLGLPRGPESEIRMYPSEVGEILTPLGFNLHKIIEFSPYHYGSVFTK